jgi:hypothetical protein
VVCAWKTPFNRPRGEHLETASSVGQAEREMNLKRPLVLAFDAVSEHGAAREQRCPDRAACVAGMLQRLIVSMDGFVQGSGCGRGSGHAAPAEHASEKLIWRPPRRFHWLTPAYRGYDGHRAGFRRLARRRPS